MIKTTVDQSRVDRLLSPEIHFRSGKGSGINEQFDACLMQAVDWVAGGDGSTDAPECASPKDQIPRAYVQARIARALKEAA